MRHRKAGVKLNRTSSHRKAMFRNMVTSILKHEKIQTTDTKAKALRAWVDHVITLAKRGDLHARRQALAIVREKNVVHKLFSEAVEKFGGRDGGYTRITKLGRRQGDAAPVSVMELITSEEISKKKIAKKKEMPVITPKIGDKEKETKPDLASADEKISETAEIYPSKTVAEDSGVETSTPLEEELSKKNASDTETVTQENDKLLQVKEENLVENQNQEEKK